MLGVSVTVWSCVDKMRTPEFIINEQLIEQRGSWDNSLITRSVAWWGASVASSTFFLGGIWGGGKFAAGTGLSFLFFFFTYLKVGITLIYVKWNFWGLFFFHVSILQNFKQRLCEGVWRYLWRKWGSNTGRQKTLSTRGLNLQRNLFNIFLTCS